VFPGELFNAVEPTSTDGEALEELPYKFLYFIQCCVNCLCGSLLRLLVNKTEHNLLNAVTFRLLHLLQRQTDAVRRVNLVRVALQFNFLRMLNRRSFLEFIPQIHTNTEHLCHFPITRNERPPANFVYRIVNPQEQATFLCDEHSLNKLTQGCPLWQRLQRWVTC